MKRLRKRICGAGILFLMMILAVGTMVSFAEERSTSYQLIIKKIFADGTPDEAKDVTYTFRVQAQVKGSDDPVEQTVWIKGEGEEVISFGNAFKISVIEQTDDGGFKHDGREWDVTSTYCESSMHVSASQATVNISKDGGMIEVKRPEGADVPDVTFRLEGKPFHNESGSDVGYGPFELKLVKAGETAKWDNLLQGEYTITKLRSADGFSVLVGKRSFQVDAGQEGVVHINGTDGHSKISITAPPASDGLTKTHHYLISGPDTREIDVRSGETGVVEHLAEGNYTITVSRTYDGVEGYSVTAPMTTVDSRAEYGSGISFNNTPSRKYFVAGGDYIDDLTYGPLYDKAGNILPSTVTYQFSFGVVDTEKSTSEVVYIKGWSLGNIAKANVKGYPCSLDSTPIVRTPPQSPKEPCNKRLYVGTKKVSSSKAAKFKVTWNEYTKSEATKNIDHPDPEGDTVEVDERGYIILSKPDDNGDRSHEVFYYYTITDSNGAKIKDFTVTDEAGNSIDVPINTDGSTVILKAGQTVKISGLLKDELPKGTPNANFTIKETVKSAPKMGFGVTLEDTEKRVTYTGGSIEIETLGERAVTIRRPGNSDDDYHRIYTYKIYESGKAEPIKTIKLESGQETTVKELPAGKYRIVAADDQIVGFDVTYSDSSSLTSDYIRNATVAFTNTFRPIEASYHVIHEYYLENADGSYKLEGVSPVYTKNCDGNHSSEIHGHFSKEVHQLNIYQGKEYTHIPEGGDAYGKVVSWHTGDEKKDIMDFLVNGTDTPANDNRFVKNGTGYSGVDENGQIPHEYAYIPLENLKYATALPHEESRGQCAQIIILRYSRKDTPEEHGTYNIIHEYYRRTSRGDIWEGSSGLSTVNVGRLTGENRFTPHYAKEVEPILRFTPTIDNETHVEYPYVYGSEAYGRIVASNSSDPSKPGSLGGGKVYQSDASMTDVKATEAGDQIIILRYYRGGGYKVVHEYYYREAADFGGDSGETEEDSGSTTEDTNPDMVSGNDTPAVRNASGDTSPGAGDVSDDNRPEAGGESTVPPRDMAQDAENSISGNDPQNTGGIARKVPTSANDISGNNPQNTGGAADTVQNGAGDISGNDPQDTGAADTAQNNTNAAMEMPEENTELEAYGIMPLAGEEGSFNGTLTNGNGYIYEFEGKREIVSYSADLESKHNAGEVRKENLYRPSDDEQYLYAFKDAVYGYMDGNNPGAYRVAPFMTGVTATSAEDEIIILRYIRGDGVKEPEPEPTPPENPPGGGGGGGSNPPPEDPEIPEIPDLPTELPDPNDPDSPDRITILEDGVPRTYVKVWDFDKQEWVYIPEEDVPLWKTSPQTADEAMPIFWFVLAAGSAGGIVLLRPSSKKKR